MARTSGRLYKYRGKQMTFGELAAVAKVSYSVLSHRLHHLHWSVENAVETPIVNRAEAGRRGKQTAVKLHLLRG